jgi:hypothetical protein
VITALFAGTGSGELGHPVVREFPPGKSLIGHVCQALTQDAAGHVYLANDASLRCYDGTVWRPIKLPTECAGIRKFATTANGTIFAGGAGVIGWLRGAGADAEFVSLADRLPPTALGHDEIFDVLAVGATVYFADEEKILAWRDGRFTVIPYPSPPRSRGARLHRVGDAVYVTALDRPLCRLVGNRLEVVAEDHVLRDNQIITIEEGAAGTLTLLTARQGFFQLVNGRVTPLAVEANRWLAGRTIMRAQRLADGSRAVAFTAVSGWGGMRFDPQGRYVGPIDSSIGLYVNTVRDFLQDHEGGLWLGTDTGVLRIEWPSAVSVFDAVNGLGSGAVVDVARHEGVLHAATGEGVFRLWPGDATGRVARFERVHAYPAYALASHPGGLLVVGYNEVLVMTATGFSPVAALPAGGGSLYRSKRDPDRVWITSVHGIQSIRHTPAGWRDEGPADPKRPRDEISADFLTPGYGGDPTGTRWRVDNAGIARVPPGGGEPQYLPQLVNRTAGAVAQLHEETDRDGAVLWVCGFNGLLRVEVVRAFPAPVPFATRLTAADVREGEKLTHEHGELSFGFLALRHQLADAVTYQTRLTGFDRDWSPWSPRRERTLAKPPPGRYRFEVHARDADGRLSTPDALAFAVLPPWWGTWWAIIGFAAGGLGLVAGVVHVRTRALHRRTEHLEGIVAARTAELARKNTELIRLNQLELDEKISARLAEEKARFDMLRYQLNPHFLYNTLASISAALPGGLSPVRAMVERLAEFCRLTLHRSGDSDWTTLGEELQLLRTYLGIEQSRWGDLLDVAIDCDPALADERLPHFLLLPLVENALKYGRATSPERVGLRLAARREGDGALVLEVANTGEWIEPTADKSVSSLGIGLENLRERLARHYPHSHRLDITQVDGWVTVTLHILPLPSD